MAKEPRKPLRERVAERQAAEMRKKRGAEKDRTPASERAEEKTPEAARSEQAKLWWRRLALFGMALQAIAILGVVVEAFLLWSGSFGEGRWQWLILYSIVFIVGRVLNMVGDAQRRQRRPRR